MKSHFYGDAECDGVDGLAAKETHLLTFEKKRRFGPVANIFLSTVNISLPPSRIVNANKTSSKCL